MERSYFVMTDDWVMDRTRRHRTTVMRWRRSRTWPPELLRLAAVELGGEIGLIDTRWDGWRLCARKGRLFPPQAYADNGFTPGEILAFWWNVQRMHALELELSRLKRIGPLAVEPDGDGPPNESLMRAMLRRLARG